MVGEAWRAALPKSAYRTGSGHFSLCLAACGPPPLPAPGSGGARGALRAFPGAPRDSKIDARGGRGGLRERNARPRGNSFASRQRCRAAAFVPRTEPRALAQINKGAWAGATLRGAQENTSGAPVQNFRGEAPRSFRKHNRATFSHIHAPHPFCGELGRGSAHPRARGGPKSAAGRSWGKLRRRSPGSRSRTFGAKPREASENTTGRAAPTSTR